MFITFEGGEGAGKSTQAARLVDRLRAAGYRAHFTKEPGGTPLAAGIRALLLHPDESLVALARSGLVQPSQSARPESPLNASTASASEPDLIPELARSEPILPTTELLLHSAARSQHVARMREWLEAGEIVVCDRYIDSTWAYQGAGRDIDDHVIGMIEQIATDGLRPDVTLLLDLPVELGQQRKRRHLRRTLLQLSLFESPAWNRIDNETVEFHSRVRNAYLELAAREPDRFVVLDATLRPNELAAKVWAVIHARLPSVGTSN